MRLKWQVKAIFVQLLWIMGRADKGGSKGEGRRGQKCREGITIAEMDVVALNDCWHGMAIWAAAKIWLCLWTQPKAVAFQFPSPSPRCTHILAAFTFQYPFDGNEFILNLYLMWLQKFLIDGLQGDGVPQFSSCSSCCCCCSSSCSSTSACCCCLLLLLLLLCVPLYEVNWINGI